MLSIFTEEFFNIPENKELIYSLTDVGNLKPTSLDGTENKYIIAKGVVWPGVTTAAPEQVSEETNEDYSIRVRTTTLQAFVDLQTGDIEAIELDNEQLKLLLQQPEFKQEESL